MSSIYTHVAADYAKDQQVGALVEKIEVKGAAEDASDFVEVGPLRAGSSLKFPPRSAQRSGNIPQQFGYAVELVSGVLATGDNIRTSLNNICTNATDVRITTINGKVFTLPSTRFGLEIGGDTVEGEFEDANYFPLTGMGVMTAAEYAAARA